MNNQQDYFSEILSRLDALVFPASVEFLQQIAKAHHDDPRPLFLLAGEYAQACHYDAAEAAYIATLQCAPNFAIARFQLGLLQLTSGRPVAAAATWAPLDSLEMSDPLRLFKVAFEHLVLDELEEASALLEEGVSRCEGNPPLIKDMNLILSGIARLKATAAEPASASETTAGEHFLVSTYRNLH